MWLYRRVPQDQVIIFAAPDANGRAVILKMDGAENGRMIY